MEAISGTQDPDGTEPDSLLQNTEKVDNGPKDMLQDTVVVDNDARDVLQDENIVEVEPNLPQDTDEFESNLVINDTDETKSDVKLQETNDVTVEPKFVLHATDKVDIEQKVSQSTDVTKSNVMPHVTDGEGLKMSYDNDDTELNDLHNTDNNELEFMSQDSDVVSVKPKMPQEIDDTEINAVAVAQGTENTDSNMSQDTNNIKSNTLWDPDFNDPEVMLQDNNKVDRELKMPQDTDDTESPVVMQNTDDTEANKDSQNTVDTKLEPNALAQEQDRVVIVTEVMAQSADTKLDDTSNIKPKVLSQDTDKPESKVPKDNDNEDTQPKVKALGYKARVLFTFLPHEKENTEISVSEGDIVILQYEVGPWVFASKKDGESGYIPKEFCIPAENDSLDPAKLSETDTNVLPHDSVVAVPCNNEKTSIDEINPLPNKAPITCAKNSNVLTRDNEDHNINISSSDTESDSSISEHELNQTTNGADNYCVLQQQISKEILTNKVKKDGCFDQQQTANDNISSQIDIQKGNEIKLHPYKNANAVNGDNTNHQNSCAEFEIPSSITEVNNLDSEHTVLKTDIKCSEEKISSKTNFPQHQSFDLAKPEKNNHLSNINSPLSSSEDHFDNVTDDKNAYINCDNLLPSGKIDGSNAHVSIQNTVCDKLELEMENCDNVFKQKSKSSTHMPKTEKDGKSEQQSQCEQETELKGNAQSKTMSYSDESDWDSTEYDDSINCDQGKANSPNQETTLNQKVIKISSQESTPSLQDQVDIFDLESMHISQNEVKICDQDSTPLVTNNDEMVCQELTLIHKDLDLFSDQEPNPSSKDFVKTANLTHSGEDKMPDHILSSNTPDLIEISSQKASDISSKCGKVPDQESSICDSEKQDCFNIKSSNQNNVKIDKNACPIDSGKQHEIGDTDSNAMVEKRPTLDNVKQEYNNAEFCHYETANKFDSQCDFFTLTLPADENQSFHFQESEPNKGLSTHTCIIDLETHNSRGLSKGNISEDVICNQSMSEIEHIENSNVVSCANNLDEQRYSKESPDMDGDTEHKKLKCLNERTVANRNMHVTQNQKHTCHEINGVSFEEEQDASKTNHQEKASSNEEKLAQSLTSQEHEISYLSGQLECNDLANTEFCMHYDHGESNDTKEIKQEKDNGIVEEQFCEQLEDSDWDSSSTEDDQNNNAQEQKDVISMGNNSPTNGIDDLLVIDGSPNDACAFDKESQEVGINDSIVVTVTDSCKAPKGLSNTKDGWEERSSDDSFSYSNSFDSSSESDIEIIDVETEFFQVESNNRKSTDNENEKKLEESADNAAKCLVSPCDDDKTSVLPHNDLPETNKLNDDCLVNAGSHDPLVNAGSHDPLVNAGSHDPLVNAGSHDPLVNAGSHDPLVNAGSHDPLVNGTNKEQKPHLNLNENKSEGEFMGSNDCAHISNQTSEHLTDFEDFIEDLFKIPEGVLTQNEFEKDGLLHQKALDEFASSDDQIQTNNNNVEVLVSAVDSLPNDNHQKTEHSQATSLPSVPLQSVDIITEKRIVNDDHNIDMEESQALSASIVSSDISPTAFKQKTCIICGQLLDEFNTSSQFQNLALKLQDKADWELNRFLKELQDISQGNLYSIYTYTDHIKHGELKCKRIIPLNASLYFDIEKNFFSRLNISCERCCAIKSIIQCMYSSFGGLNSDITHNTDTLTSDTLDNKTIISPYEDNFKGDQVMKAIANDSNEDEKEKLSSFVLSEHTELNGDSCSSEQNMAIDNKKTSLQSDLKSNQENPSINDCQHSDNVISDLQHSLGGDAGTFQGADGRWYTADNDNCSFIKEVNPGKCSGHNGESDSKDSAYGTEFATIPMRNSPSEEGDISFSVPSSNNGPRTTTIFCDTVVVDEELASKTDNKMPAKISNDSEPEVSNVTMSKDVTSLMNGAQTEAPPFGVKLSNGFSSKNPSDPLAHVTRSVTSQKITLTPKPLLRVNMIGIGGRPRVPVLPNKPSTIARRHKHVSPGVSGSGKGEMEGPLPREKITPSVITLSPPVGLDSRVVSRRVSVPNQTNDASSKPNERPEDKDIRQTLHGHSSPKRSPPGPLKAKHPLQSETLPRTIRTLPPKILVKKSNKQIWRAPPGSPEGDNQRPFSPFGGTLPPSKISKKKVEVFV